MKEIIFVRHAKSDWGNEQLKDIDRPLSERGFLDAYALSEWYATEQAVPDLMITSIAARAINTALIFARRLKHTMEQFVVEESFYESTADNILAVIRKQKSSVDRLMLFGHNPGFTNICNEMSDIFFDNVPTCGIVSYRFDIKKWSDLVPKKGELNYYQFPKEFKNRDQPL
jgi:phosphohistidine phosphatase